MQDGRTKARPSFPPLTREVVERTIFLSESTDYSLKTLQSSTKRVLRVPNSGLHFTVYSELFPFVRGSKQELFFTLKKTYPVP